jgi:uncharacterized repeat protein (TIGR01451 family)
MVNHSNHPTNTSPHPKRATGIRKAHRLLFLFLILAVSLLIVPGVLADIEVPLLTGSEFIQTTGPLAALNIGDYRTNNPIDVGVGGTDTAGAGDNLPHQLVINLPCLPNTQYNFDIFDPAIDDGVAIDEPRNNANVITADPAFYDDTSFTLYAPNGATIATQTFAPGTSNDAWTTLATVTTPANPVEGVSCGGFALETFTGNGSGDIADLGLNNDDNAWRFRLQGIDDDTTDGAVVPFASEDGPDGISGTGDEAWLGVLATSYQHSASSCNDFYWFVDEADTETYMINFDLDGSVSICYFPPGSGGPCPVTGTLSGQTVWNNGVAAPRPGFSDLDTFDLVADVTGDAMTDPPTGVWRAEVCVNPLNQYSFEVPGKLLFLQPPDLPDLSIAKTDGVTTVTAGGSTTYTITITNNGTGAALPLPGAGDIELTDTLPAGMTFDSCTVNPPLIGTCQENPAGSGIIEFDLTGNTVFPNGFLPAGGTGTVTITANIDAGLADGTQLLNTAVIDYTDIYGNDHPPETATDQDTVTAATTDIIDLEVDKTVDNPIVNVGDTVVFTIQVVNNGPDDATGVVLTDADLAGIDYTNVAVVGSPSQGTYTVGTGMWNIGALAAGATAEINIQADVNAAPPLSNVAEITAADQTDIDSIPGNGDPGEDDQDSALLIPAGQDIIDLEVDKTVDDPTVEVGDTVVFTIQVVNKGPDDATGVALTDADLASSDYTNVAVVGSPSQGTYNVGTGVWNIGALAAGATAEINIQADVNATPPLRNVAEITAADQTDIDSIPGNGDPGEDDQDSASLRAPNDKDDDDGGGGDDDDGGTPPTVTPVLPFLALTGSDPALVKTGSPANAVIGETVTWVIRVSNPSSAPIGPLTITDNVPPNFDILSASSTVGTPTISGQNVTVDIGTLQPGDSVTLTIETAANDQALPGEVCNTATAGTLSDTACITLFPEFLPLTGGGPPPHPMTWIIPVMLGGALVVVIWRRRAAGYRL